MDVRHPLYQAIASVLTGILFLNPIVAAAAELAVDAAAGGNTHLGAAGNGVPVVNIATPNGAGLSHNKFTDYNVGQNGLILNNATGKTQSTQLGGIIVGNPNLKGGSASKILNEVTGANASQLRGYTEVAGQSAHVIVSNPHGITCNGCGFINTPRATLTTGKPLMDGERLRGYDVDGGEITVEGAGLNASNLDQFELITRSAKLNADLYAKQLAMVTGRNQVDAETLAATAKADDGSAKPQLAIDSSALGGMYAGAIRLVGTEQGVGVKLAGNMAASAGDIQIDANGQLSLAQTSAAGSLRAKAQDIALSGPTYAGNTVDLNANGQLNNSQSLAAGQRVALSAAQVSNSGIVEAGVNADNSRNAQGDMTITAQNLRNSGSAIASRNLEVNASGTLDNQGGALKGADTRVTAANLDNRQGRLLANNQLTLSAARLDNRSGKAVANHLQVSGGALDNRLGLFSAEQTLDFTLDSLDNSGQGNLVSNGTLQARVQQKLDNQADGLLSAKGALGVQAGNLDNRGGLVVGDAGVTVSGASLNNSALGVISSLGELKLDVGQLDNSQGGSLDSGAALNLTAGQVNNNKGSVSAKSDLLAKADNFSQQGGELLAQGALNLEAGQLDNRNGGLVAANNGVTLKGGDLLNQGGEISSRAKVDVQAASLDNAAGKVIGDAGLNLQVQRLANRAGTLAGRDGLTVTGQSLDNSQGGLLSSQKNLWLQLSGALDNSGNGALLSQGPLTLNAGSLDNRTGTVSSAGLLFSRLAGALNNQGGKLLSDAAIDLAGADLNNAGGVISAAGDVSLQGAKLDNSQKGRIVTDADIHLATAQLDNSQGGSLSARGVIDGRVTGLDQHGGGQLIGQAGIDLDLQGGALNNAGGLLGSPGQLVLRNVASLDNRGGEISSDRAFTLTTGTLLNQGGKILSSDRLTLATAALNNSNAGVLSGSNGLSVTAASLDNSQGGTLASRGDLLVRSQGALDNHGDGALVAGGKLDVGSASLNNQGGLLSASGNLLLATGTTDNRDGRLLAQGRLDGTTADLDNRDGVISGAQGLDLGSGNVFNGTSATGKPGGLITSQGALTLRGGKLDATGGGEISAKGDLHLIVAQLIQQQAALIGEGKVTLDLGTNAQRGDFDNRGGLLSAGGPLTINGLGNLDNRGGEISASQGFTLTASGTLDNRDQGRLISAGQLNLNANTLRNANQGLLSGWQGLVVNAASLDNSSGGTVSSRDGALTLTLSGALDNHDEGALVSKGKLSLDAGSLNNAGGIVSTQGDLGLTLTGDLDNSAAGLLSTQGSLTGSAKAINNGGGQISAASVGYDAKSLDNSGGTLISQGALRLGLLGALLNNGAGSKIASGGPLNLTLGSLQNHGGQLASQGLLKVIAGTFDNSVGGTVAAQTDLTLTLTGELLNGQDGLIFAKTGQLSASASRIDNSAGTLQGQGDTNLKATGALGNQGGRVISQNGQLDLRSASLDNANGGVFNAANGDLKLVTGTFSNNAGITQAKGLDITATGGIDNRTGHLSAVSGDNRISTTDLNNQGGGLYAANLLSVSGAQLQNQSGKIGARTIDLGLTGLLNNQGGLVESSGVLLLAANTVDNQNGRLRALGTTGSTAITASSLDNRNGVLETANENLNLSASNLFNEGGRVFHAGSGAFSLDADEITRAGGSFITTGRLDITADSWTNSSVLQAGWLNLNIGQFSQTASGQLLASQGFTGRGSNWSNDGLLASDGSLDIQLTGTYGGAGRVTSLGSLSLSAGQIDLAAGGSIAGGQNVTLDANLLTNRGRMTAAGDLTVNSGTLNNYATLGSAGNLRVNTWDLLNDGQAQGALIFSGDDMAMRVGGTLTNRYADIYSLGDLDLVANDAGGWTTALNNISATVESLGDMRLQVQTIENRTDGIQTAAGELISAAIGVRCYDCTSPPETYFVGRVPASHLVWELKYKGEVQQGAPRSNILAGANLTVVGGGLINSASTISAGGNIGIEVQNFRNEGMAIGDYSVRKSFTIPYTNEFSGAQSFWTQVMNYNAANDPDYQFGIHMTSDEYMPSLHFWNANWDESLPTVFLKRGGREGPRYAQFGSIRTETYDFEFQLPHYQPGALVDAPAIVKNATFFDELIVQTGTSSFVNAVVQAGGNVTINATKNLTNSVIQEGVPLQGGSSRVGDTGVGSNTATVVQLNSQLPPDLAQQQVNPITLPGFTLPTGSNGLFRLSGDEGNQGAAQAVAGAGGFTFTGQSIGPNQRERALSGAVAQADDVALGTGNGAQGATGEGSFTVARVQGVPSSATPDNSHKYLIETNPDLTSLKSFLSSDYLLGLLGYDADQAQKRLGDGLYEQRLIRDAVVARTGQRYIDGMTSDEALFKYLMDNAIAYKDSLNLSLGVALTAEQVAALTHDIVWLEEATVNGQKVLVPVVYLAQADNRLAANGALIMGNDVSLIAGGDLTNQGTLRASGDLAATAANINNSGLIESSGRLDLLALDSIRNTQGGIIAGRDVSLAALTGDVINERSVTVHDGSRGNRTWTESFADSAARIEAASNLDISAGRDINNLGGSITSGRDLSMQAGRDVNLTSVEVGNGRTNGRNYNQTTTQLMGDVSSGRDLDISAGRDLNAVASRLEAARDAALSAGRDVTLASAADEQHSYDKTKKVTRQEDHVDQRSTELNAGGDVLISAGENITLVSSKIGAGNEAYLVAGDKIEVLAANDSDYSLYDKKSKGSFGKKQTRHDEVTDVKAVSSEITAGSDITLLSGGDQKYQAAKLESGNDIAIISGGAVTFEAAKDLHQEAHEKTDNSFSWNSSKGKGSTDETVRQTQMIAQGDIAIKAVDGLNIDYQHIDKQSVSQAIDAMVQADPGLAWLKEAEARGDVDWRAVKEIHDSYKYSHSGLSGPAMLAIVIIVTYFTAGAASGAIGSAAGATAGSGSAMAAAGTTTVTAAGVTTTTAVSAGWANVALTAVATSAASQAAISTINNRGDLGAVAKDVTSSDALKGYAAAGISAGYSPQNIGLQLSVNAALRTVTQGGSFKDNLGQAAIDMVADAVSGVIYNNIGDALVGTGLPTKVAVHALAGGLMAEAAGGDFRTGAMAAGANEAVVAAFGEKIFPGEQHEKLLAMTSNLIGMTVAAAGGGDAKAQEKAGWVAQQATLNNWLLHEEIEAADRAREGCVAQGGDVGACQRNITQAMDALDQARNLDMTEYGRSVQELAYKEGWSLEQYNTAMQSYWQGIDPSQVTTGYAPAQAWQYVASQMGAGISNAAVTWPGRTLDSVVNVLTHLTDIPKNVVQAGSDAVDWLNSPIPGQALERVGDQVLFATPEQVGGLAFDLTAGTITSTIGGKAVEWIGGKWVAATPKGTATAGRELTPVFKDADTGLNAVNPVTSNNRGRIQELGLDPDKGKVALHEGQAAVQLENALGGTLKRAEPVLGQKNPDFVFVDGPYAGKTVDFMWTDSTRSAQINQFFSNNAVRNQEQLIVHVNKADIVPLDYRNLTPVNQGMVNSWIKALTPEQQSKILILR